MYMLSFFFQNVPNECWQITRINEKFDFCETYPALVCFSFLFHTVLSSYMYSCGSSPQYAETRLCCGGKNGKKRSETAQKKLEGQVWTGERERAPRWLPTISYPTCTRGIIIVKQRLWIMMMSFTVEHERPRDWQNTCSYIYYMFAMMNFVISRFRYFASTGVKIQFVIPTSTYGRISRFHCTSNGPQLLCLTFVNSQNKPCLQVFLKVSYQRK